MTVSADQIAQELVKEARRVGVDPVRVFEPDMQFVRVKVARRMPAWARILQLRSEALA